MEYWPLEQLEKGLLGCTMWAIHPRVSSFHFFIRAWVLLLIPFINNDETLVSLSANFLSLEDLLTSHPFLRVVTTLICS